MNATELKREIVKFCNLAYARHLVSGGGGNISVRSTEDGLFHVTPSGMSLRDVTEDCLITVNAEGIKTEGAERSVPSMETRMHLSFYQVRPETKAVVHLHPVHCVALANADYNLNLASVSAEMILGKVGLVADHPAGSRALADEVAETMRGLGKECHTLFLRRHGVISCGSSVAEAFDRVDMAEEMASILCWTRFLGKGE